jgi:hypothetical protein
MFAEAGATVLNADVEAHPDHIDTPTHEVIEAAGGPPNISQPTSRIPSTSRDLLIAQARRMASA